MGDTLDTIQAYADAWKAKDFAALAALYADGFTLHYPGQHRLSGIHAGKPAALAALRQVTECTGRQLIEVVAVMGGEGRGALEVVERWTRPGEVADVRRVFVYDVADGLLQACWLYDADSAVIERFLGAGA